MNATVDVRSLMTSATPIHEPEVREKLKEKPKMPAFKDRWYHRKSHMDIRPVCWSLRNRPEEWTVSGRFLLHVPSNHYFSPSGSVSLQTHCDCSTVSFGYTGLIQQIQFKRAVKDWKNGGKPESSAGKELFVFDTYGNRRHKFSAHFV